MRYNSLVPDSCVGISYLGFPELNQRNIGLANYGPPINSDIYCNTLIPIKVAYNGLARTFQTKIIDFLLTDVYNSTSKYGELPLFYGYQIIDRDGVAVNNFSNLRILDKDMKDVDADLWQQQVITYNGQTSTYIYHALLPSFDIDTDTLNIYYITYKIPNGDTIFSILGSNKVFQKYYPGLLVQKTYTLQTQADKTYKITISGPLGTKYYFQPLVTGQIKGILPPWVNNNSFWKLRFTAGGFTATKNSITHRYLVPEFYSQSFYQNRKSEKICQIPIINNMNQCVMVANNAIQSPYYPLIVNKQQMLYTTIIVLNGDGIPYAGYTNDPTKLYWNTVDNQYRITLGQLDAISDFSWDLATGFIRLPISLNSTDIVLIEGFYYEQYLNYEDLELNPIFNPTIINKQICFYVRPQYTNSDIWSEQSRGIYHLIIDSSNQIVDYVKDIDGTPLDPEFKANMVLDFDQFQKTFPEKLIVSKCRISSLTIPDQVTEIDIRQSGGGIKESVDIDNLVNNYPEILWISNQSNWDGRPYPGVSAISVELPEENILDMDLSKAQVSNIVSKHMALGNYPIIQYYTTPVQITKIYGKEINSQPYMFAEWNTIPHATSYNIYQVSGSKLEIQTKIGSTENTWINDLLLNFSTGLYRIMITAVERDEEGHQSKVYSFRTDT